ncbi:MAG TPA: tetratricopeptide repeat protein [Gemmatimonadales bacterium]|nr:tetratricopeptide repeat protein [Gemmatimonadales bacterium]
MESNLHRVGRVCLALLLPLALPSVLAAQAPCPPEAGRRLESAWTAYRADSLEAARARFAEVTRACPAVADAWAGLGFAALRLGDVPGAEQAFRRALEADRRSADAWDGLAHALARSGRNVEAAAAAREALAVAPGYAASRELLSRLDPDWDRPPIVPKPRPDSLTVAVRVRGAAFEVPGPTGWAPLFLRGVNLGAALPGRFPAEFPTDSSLYRGWLDSMAAMGANVVRVYTVFPPAFYRALRARNLAHPGEPLRLVQGVWTELPPGEDFGDPAWLGEFRAEMRRAVDVIHGAVEIPSLPGHAGGRYDADVSPWVAAWILGREWEPFAVAGFDQGRPRADFRGRWFTGDSLPAMDRWLAEQCDYLVDYEVERHNAIRPVAYTNWPTLDPLVHPTESGAAEEAEWRRRAGRPLLTGRREYENDRIGLDANLVRPTDANPAGWFASYHAYPYYPDFLLHDPAYAAARSSFGPSSYFGYLRELVRHHAGLPVLVAEFGVPSSRGLAHWQPQGLTHGGLDEAAHAVAVSRLAAEVRESGAAGALVFAWLDEWFKHNWVTIDLEVPREHNARWLNVEDAEQQYGLLGLYAGDATGPRLGGDPDAWRALPILQRGDGPLRALRAGHDEAFVYLAVETDPAFDFSEHDLALALDVIRPDLGQRRMPGGLHSEVGFEFLLELRDTSRAALLALPEYNPYAGREALEDGDERGRFHRRPVRPIVRDDARWDSLLVIVNRARFGRDGTFFPARLHDRGRLRHGSQAESSLADWHWQRGAGLVTIRIPWALLNVTDPSTGRVAFEFTREGEFGTVVTEGIRAGLLLLDEHGARLDALPTPAAGRWRAEAFTPWRWPEWTEPRFHWRLKPAFASLRQLWSAP